MNHAAGGFTLLELIVSLAILGVCLGLVAAAVVPSRPEPESSFLAPAEAARDSAVRTGRTVALVRDSTTRMVFFPDGSAIPVLLAEGRDTLRIDPWTGDLIHAR
ncbi:MAG: prepilin-type N-terminal cleavage/methylation domain-containing protein [Gemmatimonadetes bacterium]|nr:prepilin-type N-terminal cleavage/methylation domain-containing protein [Gemmatimonadota bacterium]